MTAMTQSSFPVGAPESAKTGMRLPDFFICGAAKAGTTSMWRYLQQHPEIFMPKDKVNKEPGYFSHLRPLDDFEQYVSLFQQALEHQIIGEASGAYLTSPDSAVRIAETLPDAKIIIMLRNPADRAYSLYKWMVREGYEYAGSFEDALHLEKSRRYKNLKFRHNNPEYYYNYLYYGSGLYAKQVRRYIDSFPRCNLKIVIFEEIISKEIEKVKEIYKFLNVEKSYHPNLKVHNKGKDVRSPIIQYVLKNYCRPVARKALGQRGARWIKRMMRTNVHQEHRSFDPSLRQQLLERYQHDIRRTSSLIDKDLESVWLEN